MTMESFNEFIDSFFPNVMVPVDLVKLAKNTTLSNVSHVVKEEFLYNPPGLTRSPLRLVMDGECCLDRLYGGYFSNWVCGGQWNKMAEFLKKFFEVAKRNNIEISVIFNGAVETHMISNWVEKQKAEKEKMARVMKHISKKGTPPPKVWWTAPNGLRSCLRMILRQLKINIFLTTADHHQEVMIFMKRFNFHGLLADDPEYIMYQPPRYFSASALKLTFKGCLETKECDMMELNRCLNLPPNRICVVAALLGNHILTKLDLAEFHRTLCVDINEEVVPINVIKAIVDYVRDLPSVKDLNAIAWEVFGRNSEEKLEKLKQCVQYYSQGNEIDASHTSSSSDSSHFQSQLTSGESSNFASENEENQENEDSDKSSLLYFHRAFRKRKPLSQLSSYQRNYEYDETSSDASASVDSYSTDEESYQETVMDVSGLETSVSALSLIEIEERLQNCANFTLPEVSSVVMATALERHQNGLMHPYIYQILSEGEIKIPVSYEADSYGELPIPATFFRPVRQKVYALLFPKQISEDKEKGVENKVPLTVIKEWVCSSMNKYDKADIVHSVDLGFPAPTVHQLWFDSGPEASKNRLKVFLTCMRSYSLLMCDQRIVPQRFIILCCVLRYMLCKSNKPFLYRYELDAFLVQALDPHLMDAEYTQNLEVPEITQRGVLLASIFMDGVDHALMVNDACGAPIPWLTCCPWLFFDGKIFHQKLLKASYSKDLGDLCDNKFEVKALVDQMQSAIYDGIKAKFLPFQGPPLTSRPTVPNYPANIQAFSLGRGRGYQRNASQGGQLVGSWGPNYGRGSRSPNRRMPTQTFSFGGVGRGRAAANNFPRRDFGAGRAAPVGRSSSSGRTTGSSMIAATQLPRLGMGRGALPLEGAKSQFYDLVVGMRNIHYKADQSNTSNSR